LPSKAAADKRTIDIAVCPITNDFWGMRDSLNPRDSLVGSEFIGANALSLVPAASVLLIFADKTRLR
jgi:hypothetical protein